MGTIALITEHKLINKQSLLQLDHCLQDMEIVKYNSVQKLINNYDEVTPDLVIVDSDKNFLRAKDFFSGDNVKIVICLKSLNRSQIQELLTFDFDGFLLSNMNCIETINAVTTILRGETYIHPEIVKMMFVTT